MKRRDNGGRGDLTDKQWQKLQPLLPPQKAHTGQPACASTAAFSMVFFGYIEGVRRGETFQNVMACHSTISSRFYRWRAEGL